MQVNPAVHRLLHRPQWSKLLLVSVQTYLRVGLDRSGQSSGWLAEQVHEAVPAVTVQTRFGSANLATQSSLVQHCWQGPVGEPQSSRWSES